LSPRKAVAKELSRERILEESCDLFASQGYHNLTMRSIAKAMGYSHGALYYHFKDKAELFYALIKEDFSLLLNTQRQLLEKTNIWDQALLNELMLEFIKFGLDHPHHYEIMFLIKDPDLKQHSRTEQALSLELFASVVRRVLSEQSEIEQKMVTVPYSLFMSLHGFISYSIHFNQTYADVKNLAEAHVKYLCNGIICNSF
jgi:AcrR family transcriptional regulator